MPTYYSGYVDVIWVEHRGGTEDVRFRLSSTMGVPTQAALGDSPVGGLPGGGGAQEDILVVRLSSYLASGLVMASLLEAAVVHRLHVAVAYEDTGGQHFVTDIRVIGPGGRFIVPFWTTT